MSAKAMTANGCNKMMEMTTLAVMEMEMIGAMVDTIAAATESMTVVMTR